MSANNWGTCPKCEKAWRKRPDVVKEAYGKVPFSEYEQLVREAAHGAQVLGEDLREDWEIYMCSDKGFVLHYSCECKACGYNYSNNFEDRSALAGF